MNNPMTDAERAELRRLAEATNPHGSWWHRANFSFLSPADADYLAACSPAAVLALLDDRDRLAAEVARLRAELDRHTAAIDAGLIPNEYVSRLKRMLVRLRIAAEDVLAAYKPKIVQMHGDGTCVKEAPPPEIEALRSALERKER